MRRLILVFLVALLVIAASLSRANPTHAQQPGLTIKPGEPVSEEFTKDASEFRYTFDGKQDAYVIIIGAVTDRQNSKLRRTLTLLDPNGKQIAAGYMNFLKPGPMQIFLPADGTYTIVAGADPNATPAPEESVGKFQLRLDVAPVLAIGKTVTGTFSTTEDGFNQAPAYVVVAASNLTLHVTSPVPAAPNKPMNFSVYLEQGPLPNSGSALESLELARLDIPLDWAGDVSATLPASKNLYLILVNAGATAWEQNARDFTLVVNSAGK